jgi:hypothetical protein
VGGVLTMLQQSGLIKAFWGEAILTANYLQNRTPTKSIDTDKTTYEFTAYALIQIDHRK